MNVIPPLRIVGSNGFHKSVSVHCDAEDPVSSEVLEPPQSIDVATSMKYLKSKGSYSNISGIQ